MPTHATWDALHDQGAGDAPARSSARRSTSCSARTQDEALARRALDLALTNEPGKTISAGIITAVAGAASAARDRFRAFALDPGNQLIDISGRSRFMQRLVGGAAMRR